MNYIITSPYYPENFQQFSIELNRQGVTVLGIGQEPYNQLNPELRDALTEYYRVNNLEDYQEVVRAVAFFFHKYGPIDRLESHNEYWLELDAALRTQFNIPGIKSSELIKTKYKSAMKHYFKKAGVPVVPGIVVSSKADIPTAIETLQLPLIAKPDNGVGAASTYKLSTPEDVAHFQETWDEQMPYFLEQFVTHPTVCTYDGIIDKHGNIVFETSLTYYYSPLKLILERLDNAFYIEKEIDPKLRAYGQAIIKAFGMRERFFHIELFRTPDNDYIALEYNNRPAGGFAIEVYNFAHHTNLYTLWAQLVTDVPHAPQAPHGQYCLAIARRDEHPYVRTHEEAIDTFRHEFQMTARIPMAFADLLGNTLFIFTTPSLKTVDNIVQLVSERAH